MFPEARYFSDEQFTIRVTIYCDSIFLSLIRLYYNWLRAILADCQKWLSKTLIAKKA